MKGAVALGARQVPLLVALAGLAGLAMLLPAAHATIMDELRIARAFFYSALVIFMIAGMVAIASADNLGKLRTRGVILSVLAGFVLLPFLFALPLTQMQLGITMGEAWFDMLSAFTTTGAAPRYPEVLPPSITLWRAIVGWLGGWYFLTFAAAILLPMGLGGAEVVAGPAQGKNSGGNALAGAGLIARFFDMALLTFPALGVVTLLLWLALALAGESSFVALITAMGVISTSGIVAEAGGVARASGLVGEVFIFAGLLLALSRHMLPTGRKIHQQRRDGRIYDPELRLGLAIVVVTSAALFVYHWIGRTPPSDATPLRAIWGGMLLALSYLTTTGIDSFSMQMAMDWAGLQSPGMLLMGLAVMGGGAATTAGGVRLLRLYALLRHGERELEKLVHPNSLGGAGQDARYIRSIGAQKAWVLFTLFALTIAGGTALLTLTGLGFDASLAFAVAALTNTGPLAIAMPDLGLSYVALSPLQMTILGGIMVAGRLELLVLLAALSPSSWRI